MRASVHAASLAGGTCAMPGSQGWSPARGAGCGSGPGKRARELTGRLLPRALAHQNPENANPSCLVRSRRSLKHPATLRQAHVEGWAKEWELGVGDERALLLAAADCLRASKKKKAGPADGYRLALKALATYQVRSPQPPASWR